MTFARIRQEPSPQVVLKGQILFSRIASFTLKNVVFTTYLYSFGSSCEYGTALLKIEN